MGVEISASMLSQRGWKLKVLQAREVVRCFIVVLVWFNVCNGRIFETADADLENSKILSSYELKNKPDGWETISKAPDGNVWEMSQREEDILLQEFDRRITYCKFQIASFIKTHIFSRRRPIDGWKYMMEIGPNARKGKGSVSRLPSLSDAVHNQLRRRSYKLEAVWPA